MKLLIVDDSPVIRERVRKLGQTVTGINKIIEAGDLATAISAYNKHYPEIIVLDIDLHDQSGFKLISHVRRHSKHARILIFSEQAAEPCRKKAFELGADYFFDKADEIPRLINTLKVLCP